MAIVNGADIYRFLARACRPIAKLFFKGLSQERFDAGTRWLEAARMQGAGAIVYWFHAASVGELESLWPLVQQSALQANSKIVLTVFSESAYRHSLRIVHHIPADQVLYSGYSPVEGDWHRALNAVRPRWVVTAKYEAWPELWMSLSELKIPLAIIGAKWRSSIRFAARMLALFRVRLPELSLATFRDENQAALRKYLPRARTWLAIDPRWERALDRVRRPHPRVGELSAKFRDLPRPWGIIGQSWREDIHRLCRHIDEERVPGTLWVVPHRIDSSQVKEQELILRNHGWVPLRSTDLTEDRPAGHACVVVDEMGFLAELYSIMDWAWVGGGFGSGVHSTIEPAVAGLRSGCGPQGAGKFDEIPLLEGEGRLKVFRVDGDYGEFSERFIESAALPPKVREERQSRWAVFGKGSAKLWNQITQGAKS